MSNLIELVIGVCSRFGHFGEINFVFTEESRKWYPCEHGWEKRWFTFSVPEVTENIYKYFCGIYPEFSIQAFKNKEVLWERKGYEKLNPPLPGFPKSIGSPITQEILVEKIKPDFWGLWLLGRLGQGEAVEINGHSLKRIDDVVVPADDDPLTHKACKRLWNSRISPEKIWDKEEMVDESREKVIMIGDVPVLIAHSQHGRYLIFDGRGYGWCNTTWRVPGHRTGYYDDHLPTGR